MCLLFCQDVEETTWDSKGHHGLIYELSLPPHVGTWQGVRLGIEVIGRLPREDSPTASYDPKKAEDPSVLRKTAAEGPRTEGKGSDVGSCEKIKTVAPLTSEVT
jgi:hypothetical protein